MFKGMAMLAMAVMLCGGVLRAADITVTGAGGSGKVGLDLSGLKGSGQGGALTQVLAEDLKRSGWFTLASGGGIVVRGQCTADGGGARIDAEVASIGGGRLFARSYAEPAATWRRAAHRLADDIVKAVKGQSGMASMRIALIGSVGGKKNLYVCDADGQGLVQMTTDGKPCMTPSWGPDQRTIFYMSFHKGYPDTYSIDLTSRTRKRVAGYAGINAGPAVSPNGQQLAIILSRDGNAELYVMQLGSGALTRLTQTHKAAEASPTWSPDGAQIAFVSDRTGSPQIYTLARTGGAPQRVTLRGSENVNPDWGSDGRLAYSSRRGGRYQVCVLNLATSEELQLTNGGADYEEPTWAPDGRHLVAAKSVSYNTDLYLLDTLRDPEVRLTA
ncbi:MAG: hypothetical protein O3B24_08915, partial [Verrucomicrobia bacterium]|nr:hypothetical protein [Verrucomicrobiota bacterium]